MKEDLSVHERGTRHVLNTANGGVFVGDDLKAAIFGRMTRMVLRTSSMRICQLLGQLLIS
jgi:hypothetical protein